MIDRYVIQQGMGYGCMPPLSTIYQLHLYIMSDSFYWLTKLDSSTQRKPLTYLKSLEYLESMS